MTTTLAPSPPCSPTWATARNPDRRSDGGDVAATARVLGAPLIPWQRLVADVAGELDDRGRYHYLQAVVIVPRRAGKTHVALARAVSLTRRRPRSRAFYAAHRRETAAALWRDQWFPILEDSGLVPRFATLRRANGSEAVAWRHTRSVVRLLPPNGDAMRSFASDLAIIDEAREFGLDAGLAFEDACFPTQRTGLGGQTMIVSNAGTTDAAWLARWRDLGRAATLNPESRIAYFEWSAPEGADPDDDATLIAAHPGLGYHVDLAGLRADREIMSPDSFATEYLGWWPTARVDVDLIAGWDRALRPDAVIADPVVLALELSPDRAEVALVAVGATQYDRPGVELVHAAPYGVGLGAELARIVDQHRPLALVWDAAGPVAGLAPILDPLPVNMVALGTRDMVAASGHFHDAALTGTLVHRADDALGAAVSAARHRGALGAWVYDRRQPGAGPLLAAAAALWVWTDRRRQAPTVH